MRREKMNLIKQRKINDTLTSDSHTITRRIQYTPAGRNIGEKKEKKRRV